MLLSMPLYPKSSECCNSDNRLNAGLQMSIDRLNPRVQTLGTPEQATRVSRRSGPEVQQKSLRKSPGASSPRADKGLEKSRKVQNLGVPGDFLVFDSFGLRARRARETPVARQGFPNLNIRLGSEHIMIMTQEFKCNAR